MNVPFDDAREEIFEHRSVRLRMFMPRSSEALIDEAAFQVDERLPYWAELWPSAKALARHLIEEPPAPGSRVIELGCGVGLPSIALARAGFEVLATDYENAALAWTKMNCRENEVTSVRVQSLDWRDVPQSVPRFDLVIAADVLYEARNVEPLAAAAERLVGPRGAILLADPGRRHLERFRSQMTARGWRAETRASIEVEQAGSAPSRVRIEEYVRR